VVMLIVAAVLLILHFVKNSNATNGFPFPIGIYTYNVINKYDHIHDPSDGNLVSIDPSIIRKDANKYPFTQGLLFLDNDTLIESSGLYGYSYLRKFNLSTSKTEQHYNLKSNYFAEGITVLVEPSTYKKYILMLMYKEKRVFVFDFYSFILEHMFEYDLDGYGLTSNLNVVYSEETLKKNNFASRQKLWATSGDDFLYELEIPHEFLKEKKLSIAKKTKITCAGFSIERVNELEYHFETDSIYGNIFLTELIIELDITSGSCLKIISLRGLVEQCDNYDAKKKNIEAVPNGVAINPRNRKEQLPNLLVTGKLWSNIFEIKLEKNEKLSAGVILSEYFKLIGENL
ncbi:hypothetical protein, conserved, partial [Plasmodium malariae]